MAELMTRIILRNDSKTNWDANESTILFKGEMGIEFTPAPANDQTSVPKIKVKIGDGITAWKDLPYFGGEDAHVYELTVAKEADHAAAISKATTEANGILYNKTITTHDVLIVKEAIIAEDVITKAAQETPARTITQQYQHTAYRWNGTAWAAFDGNYSAESVYFSNDFTFTKSVGTVSVNAGSSKTISAAGINLQAFLNKLFAEEKNPTSGDAPKLTWKTEPKASCEAGTPVTPTYEITFNNGTYKLDGQTKNQITSATGYNVSIANLDDADKTTSKDSFSKFTIVDGMSGYAKITATADYGDGSIPKTNLGNDYDADFEEGVRQKAGTTTALVSAGYSCYRPWFYGYYANANVTPSNITSANIRALNGSNGTAKTSLPATITTGTYQYMYFAIPRTADNKTQKTVVSVKNSANDSPAGTVDGPFTAYVKGYNNTYVIDADHADDVNTVNGWAYDVYYIGLENPASGATWKIETK